MSKRSPDGRRQLRLVVRLSLTPAQVAHLAHRAAQLGYDYDDTTAQLRLVRRLLEGAVQDEVYRLDDDDPPVTQDDPGA